LYLLLTLYTVWAVSFIKSHGSEDVRETQIRD
jgi:hypothetical protein